MKRSPFVTLRVNLTVRKNVGITTKAAGSQAGGAREREKKRGRPGREKAILYKISTGDLTGLRMSRDASRKSSDLKSGKTVDINRFERHFGEVRRGKSQGQVLRQPSG